MASKEKYLLIGVTEQAEGRSCQQARAADWHFLDSCDGRDVAVSWCREWTADSGYCAYVAVRVSAGFTLWADYAVGVIEPTLLHHLMKFSEGDAAMASVKAEMKQRGWLEVAS